MKTARIAVASALLLAGAAAAQWTHRYPKIDGYGHHVYLEGFELPILGAGPTDPAPSPDGRSLAFAARGWLWLLDLESGVARRLTRGAAIDSRPAWAPDGRTLAFLRDDTHDLDLWLLDLTSGEETPLVETGAIELDPTFSQDGHFLYYSSAAHGTLDVWRLQVATSETMRLSEGRGIEVRPLPLASGDVLYLSKRNFARDVDALVVLDGRTGERTPLRFEPIASQTHPALSPDGHYPRGQLAGRQRLRAPSRRPAHQRLRPSGVGRCPAPLARVQRRRPQRLLLAGERGAAVRAVLGAGRGRPADSRRGALLGLG